MHIEIIYARPDDPIIVHCDVAEGATVKEALIASGLLVRLGMDLTSHSLGIYGKLVSLDTIITSNDRIEIYCPLHRDPKTVRLKRAKEQK